MNQIFNQSWKLIKMINRNNQKRVNNRAFPPIPIKTLNSIEHAAEKSQSHKKQTHQKQQHKIGNSHQSITKKQIITRRRGSRSFQQHPYKYQYSRKQNNEKQDGEIISRRKSNTLKRQQSEAQSKRMKAYQKQQKNFKKIDSSNNNTEWLRSQQKYVNPVIQKESVQSSQQQIKHLFKKRQNRNKGDLYDENKLKPSISMKKFIIKKLNGTKQNAYQRNQKQLSNEAKVQDSIQQDDASKIIELSKTSQHEKKLQLRKSQNHQKRQYNIRKKQFKIYRKEHAIKMMKKINKQEFQWTKRQSETAYLEHKNQALMQNRNKSSSLKTKFPINEDKINDNIDNQPSIQIQISANFVKQQSLTQRIYEPANPLKQNINQNNQDIQQIKKINLVFSSKENKQDQRNKMVTVKSVNYDQNDCASIVKYKKTKNKLKCRVGKVKWGQQCKIKQNIIEEKGDKQYQLEQSGILNSQFLNQKQKPQIRSPHKTRNASQMDCSGISPINKIQYFPFEKNMKKFTELPSIKQIDVNNNLIMESVGGISLIQENLQQAPIQSLADLYEMMTIGFKH